MTIHSAQLEIRRLDSAIDCSSFDCGEDALNRFLTVRALTEMAQRLSVTMVALSDEHVPIGFYTMSPTELAKEALAHSEGRGVPYEFVPGVRIGRLAVSKKRHGSGIGELLLRHALLKCLRMSGEFGGRVVVVDAKNAQAAAFYERFGFKSIRDKPLVLVLKVSTLANSLT